MKIKSLFIILLFSSLGFSTYGQSSLYIEGKVLDAKTKKPVPFATILVQKEKLGLYAGEEGSFTFRMRDKFESDALVISSIGYKKIVVPFSELKRGKLNILYMQPSLEQLDEVRIVSSKKLSKKEKRMRSRPKQLIREAIRRIPMNYPGAPFKYTSYYRDYLKRGGKYSNVNEAIIQTSDGGFMTSHYNNRHSLLDYERRKDFPRDGSIPQLYDSINTTPVSGNGKKFIPYATIPGQGGNELFILLAHDPIRNFQISSFAFVYQFNKDFLKNHTFKKPKPVFQDDLLLYKVEFGSFKNIAQEVESNNKDVSSLTQSSGYGRRPTPPVSNDAVIVTGEIYINPEDFTIHRLNYTTRLNSTKKKIYSLALEYGYVDESETKMRLRYISFNNEFFALEPPKFTRSASMSMFKIDWFKRTSSFILLTMSAHVEEETATYKEFYRITNNNGAKVPVQRIEAAGRKIRIYLKNPRDLRQPLNVEVSNIRDVNGRVINQRRVVRYYQYRELFVQEFNNDLKFEFKCYLENLPLNKNCLSVSPDTNKYLRNSPLTEDSMIKE